ncbi:MAG: PilZ domain-containing protein [Pseudomonadota bacterium]
MPRSATDLTSSQFFSTAALLSRREITIIATPVDIQKFFSRVFVENASIKISILHEERRLEAELAAVFGAEFVTGLRLKLPAEVCASIRSPFVNVLLSWLNEIHLFSLETKGSTPEQDVSLPQKIYKVHRRFGDRRPVSGSDLKVAIQGPDKRNLFSGELVDFSDRGFGVRCGKEALKLPLLEEVEVQIKRASDPPVSFKAEVAHTTPLPDNTAFVLGVRITRAADPAMLQSFLGSLCVKAFPTVRAARENQDFEGVADLLTAMAGVARLPNRERLIEAWKRLGEGPERPAEIFLQQRGGRVTATMTASRVYSATYLLHTFAIEKRDAFHLPVEMFYRMFDFIMRERTAEFACGMWPASHRFMDRYYGTFVRRDFDPTDHHFETTRVMRFVPAQGEDPFKAQGRYRTGIATREDEIAAWETAKSKLSPVLYEASDWGRKDIKLSEIGESYAKAGHLRRREIVTVKDGDSLLAFAVVEISSGAAGVFGLSNSFRIFFMRGGQGRSSEKQAIVKALVSQVLVQYRKDGIEACCLYGDKTWDWLSGIPGFAALLGDVSLWIVRRTRAKAFLRHLERVNWELSLFRGGKTRVRPSVLKAFDYETEPFKPRKCMRLENPEGIPGVRSHVHFADGTENPGRVVNLDTYGTSVILDRLLDVKAGDEITLDVQFENQPEFSLRSVVRYRESRVAPGFQTEVTVLGLEFLVAPMAHLETIREFVFQRLNPDVKILTEEDFEPLAHLLDRAKYFDYFKHTNHQELMEEARQTYKDLPKLYPGMARVTALRSENAVLGSHSFYRLNTKTWQLHQLAVDPDLALYKRKIPTKAVLQSTFQYLCLDPTVEYLVTYFNDEAAIARAYFEGGHSHDNARDIVFLPCRWTLVEDLVSAQGHHGSTSCGEATENELTAIAEHLLSIVPAIEYDSFSFGDPTLRGFLAAWAQTGTLRARKVFVGRDKKNEIRVFALVNLGPPNINVLGVLDNFRLFEVPWCNVDTTQMRIDLTAKVLAYYAAQDRKRAYFERDERDGADYTTIGVHDTGRTWRLIAQRRVFMTALQFFLARYGKLEERLLTQQERPHV